MLQDKARALQWMYAVWAALLFLVASPFVLSAQTPLAMPAGVPDPLVFQTGRHLTSRKQWPQRRRELLHLLTEQMYGRMPPRPRRMRFHIYNNDPRALGGIATRRQIAIYLDGREDGPRIDLLLYIPNGVKHPPVILGMNFWGNETISSDPGIRLSSNWVESGKNPYVDLSCVKDHRATERCRGINASQWPVKKILSRGYALATFYRGDLDPDRRGGFSESIRSQYPSLQKGGDNFSTIGAWAWGLSRALDYLETDRAVDPRRVVVFGWSRLGKAALWAAATDTRFAAAISNESGAGGAKLFHHPGGETIRHLNTAFPYWFCKNFQKYTGHDTTLPFDQNLMLALIAPRPLYVASAIDDTNSDPEGEFLSAKAVASVYRFLGFPNVKLTNWPPVNQPILGRVSYHVRSGGHNVTSFDWDQYLKFCDAFVKPEAQSEKIAH